MTNLCSENLAQSLKMYFPGLNHIITQNGDWCKVASNLSVVLSNRSISHVELNQAIRIICQVGIGKGFFRYFFLESPRRHPYPVEKVFSDMTFIPPNRVDSIVSIRHLKWGIRRFFYDAMLFWGDFARAYHELCGLDYDEICQLFAEKCVATKSMLARESFKEVVSIGRDDRYLVSEMAHGAYGSNRSVRDLEHVRLVLCAYKDLSTDAVGVTPAALQQRTQSLANSSRNNALVEFLYEDTDDVLNSEEEVITLYVDQWNKYKKTRGIALENMRSYLSNCNDLDVFVAASMGARDDFQLVSDMCEQIFSSDRLSEYKLRYFDPTLSAAGCPEDKGIMACLMVRAAKVILYFAQHKESFGKASECALALSQGKPVIMLCPDDACGREVYHRYRFNHPLVRQVQCNSCIVNGAIVTQCLDDVVELLQRLFSNKMEYDLDIKDERDAYYLLRERITASPVRVITDNEQLMTSLQHNLGSTA